MKDAVDVLNDRIAELKSQNGYLRDRIADYQSKVSALGADSARLDWLLEHIIDRSVWYDDGNAYGWSAHTRVSDREDIDRVIASQNHSSDK